MLELELLLERVVLDDGLLADRLLLADELRPHGLRDLRRVVDRLHGDGGHLDVLALDALAHFVLDLVLDLAILGHELLIRVASQDPPRGAPELGGHDLGVVLGADLGIELVQLGDNRAVDQRQVRLESEPLLRGRVHLFVPGGEGDVEVIDPRAPHLPAAAGELVVAGVQRVVPHPVHRVEQDAEVAWADDGLRAAAGEGEARGE